MEEEAPEVWQTRLLLQTVGYPFDTVIRGSEPEPDAIVHSANLRVGVEVTAIHPQGKALRALEGERESILRGAATAYGAGSGPPVQVSVFFAPVSRADKDQRRASALSLALFVAQHAPAARKRVEFDSADDPPPALPSGIDRLVIIGLPSPPSAWVPSDFSFPPNVVDADVLEALDRKNPKVRQYRNRYDERWLLLLTGDAGKSTWGLLDPSLKARRYESTFDRVFVFSRLQLAAVELTVDKLPAV